MYYCPAFSGSLTQKYWAIVTPEDWLQDLGSYSSSSWPLPCPTVLEISVLQLNILHCTALYYPEKLSITPYCTALHCPEMRCTALHSALCCALMHCTAFHIPTLHWTLAAKPCISPHCNDLDLAQWVEKDWIGTSTQPLKMVCFSFHCTDYIALISPLFITSLVGRWLHEH